MAEKEFVKVEIKQEDGTSKEISIYVQKPTNRIISASDKHRAKVWNQCLTDGITTKMELAHLMKERGIWNEDKDKQQVEIMTKISEIEKALYVGDGTKKTVSMGKEMAIKMRRLRIDLRELMSEKISLEENTAESISENAKFDYLVSECTKYENGDRVYKSLDDYNSKSSNEIAIAAASKLAQMLFALDEDFEKNLPENKWLSRYGLTNDDGHLINKENQKIDVTGRRVDDEGRYVNEQGKRVDIDGNMLEEDGTYVQTAEYEDEDDTKTEPVKKTRTRKKPIKADS
jgi:hypothetical protein